MGKSSKKKPHVAVIGAGAFGGWTALHLLESGARVTLIDAWGPGNSRASSGGETRVMRGTYGPNQPYTEMAARALQLWPKYERRWRRRFLHRTGVLWMVAHGDDSFERGSVELLRKSKIRCQELSVGEMRRRWPQINFADVRWGIYEPDCGYLDARNSCRAVADAFVAQGGKYLQHAVLAEGLESPPLAQLDLSDGTKVKADSYVFACGPWLGKMFPHTVGDLVFPTKQDVFFFGPPESDNRFESQHLPVWADHVDRFLYGVPGSGRRGFKVADDTRGPAFDPTSGERVVSQELLREVREYVVYRFPALKGAPLVESRVCQYADTPDAHFIVDRHPKMENVWLVGGGSGHGFKHGPVLGEMVAELILKDREPARVWRLERFRRE